MALDTHISQLDALIKTLRESGAAAKSTGGEMHGLNDSLISYGKTLLTLGGLKKVFDYAKQIHGQHTKQLDALREKVKVDIESANQADIILETVKATTALDDPHRISLQKQTELMHKELNTLMQEHQYHEKIHAVMESYPLKRMAFFAGASLTLWASALGTSHRYNQALMQANTSLDERFELVEKLAMVQAQTGLSTEATAEAAQALLGYGQDLVPEFQQNLKIVGMMQAGLGVSAQTGAELVVIFGRQLRTSAESVGNVIAQVASQTGLAAERAAQFAIEIGKALRLLGPGFRSEAAGVTAVITQLAGRVQELGGNAQAVVTMFQRMTGGTSTGFFMRGLAGVRTPGQLGSAGGAEAAMEGLEHRIRTILTAPEGTNLYAGQLEAVAEIFQVSANDVLDFQQAMKELNKPLNEGQTLVKAYKDQTLALGQSWNQMREALIGAVTAGLLPLIRYAAMAASVLADWVKYLSSSKGFIYTVRVTLPLAALRATTSLISLGAALIKVAYQSKVAEAAQLTFGKNFGKNAAALGGIGSMGGLAGVGKTGLMALAAWSGWTIGKEIRDGFPAIKSWLQAFGWMKKTADELTSWHSESRGNAATPGTASEEIKNAGHDARTAAKQALISYAKGLGSKTELDKALDQAALLSPGNRERVVEGIMRGARTQMEQQAYARNIAHGTVKTKEDQAEDEANAAALERLNEEQLKEQKRATNHSAAIREATAKTSQILENITPGFDWAHLGATNYRSYQPNFNSP